ncbi:anti-sigma factor family protein [Tenggerimyces flavus]|uniref:Anti-sigma factor family protein n=1 Tax=Tenggerimyces flavus TaxID=1708749 RepID=A0ABV7YD26_9ACTN|nr:zf-HC2 domain-containing protein [Tenggerimyces flavus]MBM7789743.1 anti-sigma factor RsiW [Tenggerimyces flavus]
MNDHLTPDDHRALRELLAALAQGQLTDAERTAVLAHLDSCPDCRAELAQLEATARSLRHADPDRVGGTPTPVPPPWLGDAIVTAIGDEARRRPRRRIVSVLAAAAAVVVIGGAGAAVGYTVAPKPPAIPLEAVAVADAAAGVTSTAGVVPHTWGMEIKLTATGFASGQRYRVVVQTADGKEALAGEFIGTGANEMHCNLNSSVLRQNAAGFRVLDQTDRAVLTSTF